MFGVQRFADPLRPKCCFRRLRMQAEEEDLDEIEREKAIVDKDDPAPPQERAHADKVRGPHRGNGKT